jgi:rhodanese-related sulfurtransferase
MARTVDLGGVQELLARGAQLVEVLPKEEYDELHIPGAVNIPLKELDASRAERLDRGRPVVVYCWDALCDMSPRAATFLDQFGFDAYDYGLSKVDWMAHGLAMEGTAANQPTARTYLRDDVATCLVDDALADVRQRIEASPYGFALVLADRVVIGRVRGKQLDEPAADGTAASVMEHGPSTTRPHTERAALLERFQRSGTNTATVTTPEGELLGVVRRDDIPSDAATP